MSAKRSPYADIYHAIRSKHETLRDEAERYEGMLWHRVRGGIERRHPKGGVLRVTKAGVTLIDQHDEVVEWPAT